MKPPLDVQFYSLVFLDRRKELSARTRTHLQHLRWASDRERLAAARLKRGARCRGIHERAGHIRGSVQLRGPEHLSSPGSVGALALASRCGSLLRADPYAMR